MGCSRRGNSHRACRALPTEGRIITGSCDSRENQLLKALTPPERARICPHLQFAAMRLGEVLYEPGARFSHVYFPTNCIVSLLDILQDGTSAEIAMVGNEGLVGVAFFMGGETTPHRAVVRSAGYAYRLIGQRLTEEFHRNQP